MYKMSSLLQSVVIVNCSCKKTYIPPSIRHIRGKEKLDSIFQINNVLTLNVIGVRDIRN